MEIKEFYQTADREYWLEQIQKSDWGAGQFLYQLLKTGKAKEFLGETTRVYLLTDDKKLVAFCTLSEDDDVRDSGLGPWIGFVYTYPEYRGHRYIKNLLDYAYQTAKSDGAKYIYISTGHTGLYEKYRYSFHTMMKDMNGDDSRIYRIEVK